MRCVITGAAGGIGLALSRRFASAGFAITGIDVDAEASRRAESTLIGEGVDARFLVADVSTDSEINHIIDILEYGFLVDVLIHCAGINHVGRFAESDPGRMREVVEVNLTGPMILTAGLLGRERLARGGSLVFVSSLSHFVGYPGAAVNAASKDGLASYARSLSVALAPRGLHVLTVYPGPTRTEHARRHSPNNSREHRRMPPERLAELVFRAVQSRRHVLIPGFINRIFATLGELIPPASEWALRRAILDKLTAE
jgi:short-subunit dehydrogenase